MRAFLAVDLTREVRNKIADIQGALQMFSKAIRFVRPEGIHLTLKFLGEITDEQRASIIATEKQANAGPPFKLKMADLGFFPSEQLPRVLWAGAVEGVAEIAKLAAGVEDRMAALGFPREHRAFSPHVTIGRVKGRFDRKLLQEHLEAWRKGEWGIIPVTSYVLYRSELHPDGARYTMLERFELK